MKYKLKDLNYRLKCAPWKIFSKFGFYEGNKIPIKFVVENADWAIKFVGKNIKKALDDISPNKIQLTTKPYTIVNSIVHFGSQYMWLNWGKYMSNNNHFITSFFHGKPEDGEEVKIHIDSFLESINNLNKVVTASSLIEKRLIKWGVPLQKIVKIPLGVDTNFFNLPLNSEKPLIRNKLGIPEHSILIGSFQKDGTGWKDGLNPKIIKGPDIFVETLKILSLKGYPVYALLTGPARGYIKQELYKNGIPFLHTYPSNHNDLKILYQALDIYLITSREEGGPMGLLESISCGIPVVSTKVGMAEDVITNKLNGFLSENIQAESIAVQTEYLIQLNSQEKKDIQIKARESIFKYDWSIVAKQHWDKIYKDLIP